MVTSAQLRAARALLNWTVRDLALVARVHRNTVTRLEADTTNAGHALGSILGAFKDFGVVFIDEDGEGPGVRLRKDFDAAKAQDDIDYLRAISGEIDEGAIEKNHRIMTRSRRPPPPGD